MLGSHKGRLRSIGPPGPGGWCHEFGVRYLGLWIWGLRGTLWSRPPAPTRSSDFSIDPQKLQAHLPVFTSTDTYRLRKAPQEEQRAGSVAMLLLLPPSLSCAKGEMMKPKGMPPRVRSLQRGGFEAWGSRRRNEYNGDMGERENGGRGGEGRGSPLGGHGAARGTEVWVDGVA